MFGTTLGKNILLSILACSFVILLSAQTGIAAGTYPNKPVKLIVPAKPGGALDNVTRMVARELEKKLGVPFPVVNVKGGASAIGIRQAANARDDGYTMMVMHQQMLVVGASGLLGFNPLDKFEGLASTGVMENYLVTYQGAPFSTIRELKEYASANPGKVKAGVNIAGLGHLVMVQIAQGLNIEYNYVNVPGGGAAKLKSLLGHFTHVGILGHGKIKGRRELLPLAVLADNRSAAAPNVASAGESDFPARFQLAFWWMISKDAPGKAKLVIEKAIEEIMADKAVQREFVSRGIDNPQHMNAQQTSVSLQEQMISYKASVSAISGN